MRLHAGAVTWTATPAPTDFYMTVRQTYSDIEVHGSYWTDRRGRDEPRFSEYSKKQKPYGSFAQAGTYGSRGR